MPRLARPTDICALSQLQTAVEGAAECAAELLPLGVDAGAQLAADVDGRDTEAGSLPLPLLLDCFRDSIDARDHDGSTALLTAAQVCDRLHRTMVVPAVVRAAMALIGWGRRPCSLYQLKPITHAFDVRRRVMGRR